MGFLVTDSFAALLRGAREYWATLVGEVEDVFVAGYFIAVHAPG